MTLGSAGHRLRDATCHDFTRLCHLRRSRLACAQPIVALMSNQCFNLMTVRGAPAELAELREQIRGLYSDGKECLFAFTNVLPPPAPVPSEWYYEHWGTTRFPSYCDLEEDGSSGELRLRFETANTEPRGVVAALSARYGDLRFELEHDTPDWDLGGRWVFAGGDVVEEEWWGDEDEVGDDADEQEDGSAPTQVADAPDTSLPPLGRRARLSALADRALPNSD
jgi:Ferredoxin-like domain in Api92-like protein